VFSPENTDKMKFIIPLLLFSFNLINSSELKIASYNVENLFDMYHNGTEYDRYIPYRDNWIKEILKIKLKNISEVICEIDADIIGLQEIENLNALKSLQKSLRYYGCRYNYLAISHKRKSAIQVALLSKIPIKAYRDIDVTKSFGIRNILETKFIIEGKPLYIFVNHWNSKRSPESKRIKSAIALKERLLTLPKGSEYILLGDFNSNYNEYKRVGKTGINMVLNSMLFREESMREGQFIHYNLWLEPLPYRRWSYNFYGDKQGLDAILLPPSLFDSKGIDYINDSFTVFKRVYMFTKEGYINRWRYKKGKHYARGYSDHLPISALFSTKPYIPKKRKTSRGVCKIKEIYNSNSLPCLLKNVKVISKKGRGATISDSKDEIFIYGVDRSIKVGRYYNIEVSATKIYRGVYEIIDFTIFKQ
jgi:endonuclease/exonuclease/phosphatase family metal-dependent hydrolase